MSLEFKNYMALWCDDIDLPFFFRCCTVHGGIMVENVTESTFLLHVVNIYPHEGVGWEVTQSCLFGIELFSIITHYALMLS